MLSTSLFGNWQSSLKSTLGEEAARKATLRAGYNEGFDHYISVSQLVGPHQGFVVAPRLGEVLGFSKVEVRSVCEAPSAFMVEACFYNSVEAEQHMLLSGSSKTPVCCYLTGFASGYCSAEREIEIYYKELECVACGHSHCLAVGRDAASWGEELAELRCNYGFNSFEDVKALWAEQRRRAFLLVRQQQRTKVAPARATHEASTNSVIRRHTMKAIEKDRFIVREPEMIEILDQAICVARLNSPVLVQGETGTGKEFLVNLIYQHSARADRPLVSVNCAAFTESLLESELFGHIRGAFTGAVTDKTGLFELAADGTLFLDELAEMPLALQAKLLRAIENGEIRRVGGNKTIKVNPRFLAATNQDLQAMIAAGKFREDLYFRLNSFVIQLPPLRERRTSIRPMVQQFLQEVTAMFGKEISGVSSEAMAYLMAYAWPGNVRELRHAIERAVVVANGHTIQLRDLPPEIRASNAFKDGPLTLEHGERQVLAQVLAEHQGDRTATAKALNISISTLWRKMKRYDLMYPRREWAMVDGGLCQSGQGEKDECRPLD
jgi:DNA-binding NtrC family response regulator